jgi:hypothetical protein
MSELLERHGGWPALLTRLLDGHDLDVAEARDAMRTILAGEATAAQLIGFVVALRAKGETPEELSGLLDAVLEIEVGLDDQRQVTLRRADSIASRHALIAHLTCSRSWQVSIMKQSTPPSSRPRRAGRRAASPSEARSSMPAARWWPPATTCACRAATPPRTPR